jgi:hypothetical protein
MKLLRGTTFMLAGTCWILAALVLGAFVLQYIAQGADLPVLAFVVSSGTVLVGLVHVVGFVSAAIVCFMIGVGLCAHGLVPPPPAQKKKGVASSPKHLTSEFRVRFGEIGRTLEYDDVHVHLEFDFTVDPTANTYLRLTDPARSFDEPRYELAVERTKRHLESLGFSVDFGR